MYKWFFPRLLLLQAALFLHFTTLLTHPQVLKTVNRLLLHTFLVINCVVIRNALSNEGMICFWSYDQHCNVGHLQWEGDSMNQWKGFPSSHRNHTLKVLRTVNKLLLHVFWVIICGSILDLFQRTHWPAFKLC